MRINREPTNTTAKYIKAAAEAAENIRSRTGRQASEEDGNGEEKGVIPASVDTLELSDEAQQRVEAGEKAEKSVRSSGKEQMDIETFKQQLENAKAQGEGVASMFEEYLQCLKIAMRIMSGDNVPPEDHRFLAEKQPDMYTRAISLRREKSDPEDYDRLSEDEEEESGAEGIERTAGTPAAAEVYSSEVTVETVGEIESS